MSIYLYSIRAKSVGVKTPVGPIRAHTLEMLHTNWQGMLYDSDCPRSHRLMQGKAKTYWEQRGGPPSHVILGDTKEGKLYRWTDETCFWIDTDMIPGDYLGEVKEGTLIPHDCAKHDRRLSRNQILCGDGSCQKVLEAKPGEVDALLAKHEEAVRTAEERQQKIHDIFAPTRAQEKIASDLGYKARDLANSKRFWEEKIADMSRDLEAAKSSLQKVTAMYEEARTAAASAEEKRVTMEAAARVDADRIYAAESATDR